ncbi:hypothetical protein LCGC14_1925460 [marine sediment metagenome]|uniref:HNH nuclease domain-containing protein n=1 Tax=marine sediment metagenome TaxID=412755 RepID=A0A0F9FQ60_9ZZZZ
MQNEAMPKPKSVGPISRKRCTIIGCTKRRYGRTMCAMHWARWRRHGDPKIVLHLHNPTRKERQAEFFNRIGKSKGGFHCWDWLGAKNNNGYGRFGHEYAHRYSYTNFVGIIPARLQIDHLCRNRSCVNPYHLEVVTPLENWRRGTSHSANNARKTHCSKGHAFTPENTYFKGGRSWRTCRICKGISKKQYRTRRRRGNVEIAKQVSGQTCTA